MLLDNHSDPPLPNLPLSPLHSFHPFPLSSRSHTNTTILRPSSAHTYSSTISIGPGPSSSGSTATARSFGPAAGTLGDGRGAGGSGGPGPSTRSRLAQRQHLDRASRRALAGRRPVGVGLGREAVEMEDEEAAMEEEENNIGMFGHRFLLPYGRRQTQMELDAAPQSPTPSQLEDDRRQEDLGVGGVATSPLAPTGNPQTELTEMDEEQPEEVVDLDASVEDMDASGMYDEEDGEQEEEEQEEEQDMEE
ncbi:hypothetical protein JCM24511_05054 [Saitozyma sp. JCM 24511]|nr:hypothetical protein JCM24511_05054 [Saitozyma sp. JCM 24511]